jgi:hypothetical protein
MFPWLRPLTGLVFVAALAIRVSERTIVEGLEAAGALGPESAKDFPLTNFLRRWVFGRLFAAGAVGVTTGEQRYINVPVYAAYRQKRRRRALFIIPVIVALGVLAYFLSPHP